MSCQRAWRGGRRAGAAGGAAGREVGWLTVRQEGGRLAGVIYLVLPRRGLWRVTAAPRSVARQTLPRPSVYEPGFLRSDTDWPTIHLRACLDPLL